MKNNLYRIFLLCLFLAGCGKDQESEKTPSMPEGEDGKAPFTSQFVAFLERQSLTCAQDCHPSVVRLVADNNGTYKNCSGLIVSPGVVVTSFHCLPSLLQENLKRGCESNLAILRPSKSLDKFIVHTCLQVEALGAHDFDPENELEVDLIEIKFKSELGATVPTFSKRGWPVEEKVKVGYFQNKNLTNTFRTMECKTALNTLAYPAAKSAFSPQNALIECPFKEDFQGGVVFNKEGEVLGLVSRQEPKPYRQKINTLFPIPEENFPLVTNLSCFFAKDSPRHDLVACDQVQDLGTSVQAALNLLSPEKNEVILRVPLEKLRKETQFFFGINTSGFPQQDLGNQSFLKWNLLSSQTQEGTRYTILPECFYQSHLWIDLEPFRLCRSVGREGCRAYRWLEKWEYEFQAPDSWEIKVETDPYLHPLGKITPSVETNYKVSFEPLTLRTRGKSRVVIKKRDEFIPYGLYPNCP